METECIFCKIQNGEIESEILYSDKHCFVIRDIAPRAPVHLLVIPNKHVGTQWRKTKRGLQKEHSYYAM